MTLMQQISRWSRSEVHAGEHDIREYRILAIKATIYRSVYILSILLGLLFSLFSICGLFVYKIEEYQGDEVQIGLWTLCTVGDDPGDYDCTDGIVGFEFYHKPGNPEVWFDCFRFFIAGATFFLFAALVYSIVAIYFTEDTTNRKYWITAVLHLIGAALILTSQTLIALYFTMNSEPFMTELRESGLGWIESTPYNEYYSDGYYVTWGCFICCCVNMALSLMMTKHDKDYIMMVNYAPRGIKKPKTISSL